MSYPDPMFDPDNAYEDDMNYDDYNDFNEEIENEEHDVWEDDYDDSMDGDWDTGMRDAGHGTDEDYGYYGEDY